MNTCELVDGSALSIRCPFCGHEEPDDLELIENDQLVHLRCANCTRNFAVAVLLCAHCAAETVCTWTDTVTPDALSRANCARCDARWTDHEAQAVPDEPLA